jgi:hypothetical protein
MSRMALKTVASLVGVSFGSSAAKAARSQDVPDLNTSLGSTPTSSKEFRAIAKRASLETQLAQEGLKLARVSGGGLVDVAQIRNIDKQPAAGMAGGERKKKAA